MHVMCLPWMSNINGGNSQILQNRKLQSELHTQLYFTHMGGESRILHKLTPSSLCAVGGGPDFCIKSNHFHLGRGGVQNFVL